MSFCTSLRNVIQIGPLSAEKMTSCRFSRWRISAILDFRGPIMGSLKSPCTTSYRSSIDTIALNCLVFEKIAFFCILATDKQTDRQTGEQMDSIDALSRSRCRERRLNKRLFTALGKELSVDLFERVFVDHTSRTLLQYAHFQNWKVSDILSICRVCVGLY